LISKEIVMLKLSFDKEKNILRTITGGVIGVDDMLKHYNTIIQSTSFPKRLNVLINCTSTDCTTKPEEIEIFYNKVKIAVKKYESIREAILVDQPYETAFVILFEKLMQIEKYEFKVFHTEDVAMNWLLNDSN
jgi:hypothetical protein